MAPSASPVPEAPLRAVGTPVAPGPEGPAKKEPEAPRGHGPLVPTVLSWPLFAVFPLFALPTWGWALWRAARRGRRSVVGAVLLCPLVAVPILSAGLALLGYATGTAVLEGRGLPGPGYFNLDRTLRCRHSSGGCVVTGHEPFTILPNNLVLVALGALFGPMPGAYDGPYPTDEEAHALLQAATPTVVRADARSLVVDGQVVDAALLRLLDHPDPLFDGDSPPSARTFRLALVEGRCLVIGHGEELEEVLLVDVQGARKVAYYGGRRRGGW